VYGWIAAGGSRHACSARTWVRR